MNTRAVSICSILLAFGLSASVLRAQEPEKAPQRFVSADRLMRPRWIREEGDLCHLTWKSGEKEFGHVKFRKDGGSPFIDSISFSSSREEPGIPIARELEPVFHLSVGTRWAPLGRPPEMSVWNVFFDKVHTRPFESHISKREAHSPACDELGDIPVVRVPGLSLGTFHGEPVLSCYPGSRLIRIEAVVSTEMDRRATARSW